MSNLSKFFLAFGIIFIILGLLFWFGKPYWFLKLPGDIVIDREHYKIIIPVASSLILSIILTIILNFLAKK
jgi:hypothetical protein